jgi:NitT/TauT family transport system permease protein
MWHLLSLYINQDILLVSPITVAKRLFELVGNLNFWQSILFSFRHIVAGFLLAVLTGIILAALAARFVRIEELLSPMVLFIKATPVASFTIIVLIWISSENLSIVISYLMVFPIIYSNVLMGIRSTDIKLLEMAYVFEMPLHRKIIYIFVPHVMPYFQSACSVGLGLCWKSGIAAEVIGIPSGSIGEKLYMSKVYLATTDIFAWTITIIIVSLAFEKLFMALLKLSTIKELPHKVQLTP